MPQFLSLKSFEYVAMLCQPFCRVEMRHIQILDRLDQFFWRVNDHDKATTAQLLDHCRSREPSETVLGTVSNRQKTAMAQLFEHRACRNFSQCLICAGSSYTRV